MYIELVKNIELRTHWTENLFQVDLEIFLNNNLVNIYKEMSCQK